MFTVGSSSASCARHVCARKNLLFLVWNEGTHKILETTMFSGALYGRCMPPVPILANSKKNKLHFGDMSQTKFLSARPRGLHFVRTSHSTVLYLQNCGTCIDTVL